VTRPARIVLVALGLAAAGAAFGALAGAVGLALAVLVAEGPRGLGWLEPFAVAAAFGAVLGVGLGPAAGWLLLRRVPLGVAVLGTLAGAVAGGAGSWLLRGAWLVGGPVGGAAAGFLAAAVALRLRYAAPRRALAPSRPRALAPSRPRAARRPPPAARRPPPNVALRTPRYAGLVQRPRKLHREPVPSRPDGRAPELWR